MNKKKVYFRADASQGIGYGHFIRSLALADMLKDDFECTFFTQSPTEYQKHEATKVCPLVALPADDTKFGIFLKQLNGDEIVVLDNYFYKSEYQRFIKNMGCKLVCIDDIHDRHFYADIIINHCVDSCDAYSAEPETKYYLGTKWALLRSVFLNSYASQNDNNHWIITFGGSDQHNLTLRYVNYLRQLLPEVKISVMVGDGYAHIDELCRRLDVRIYNKLSACEVADLFRSAGCVICSASSVCYEALACGCKVFAGYYVDNQFEFYNNLAKQQLITPLGNLLVSHTAINIGDDFAPRKMSFTNITERFRLLFQTLCFDVVKYQDVTEEQSYKIWECRNNEAIRKWMTNPEPFSFESHCNFVEKLKDCPSKLYYAFFDGGQFIGSYDFVGIDATGKAERGLFVNPKYQGNHVAAMMECYMDGEIVKHGVRHLIAEVLKINERSYKYHLRVGYKVYNEDSNYYYLERFI